MDIEDAYGGNQWVSQPEPKKLFPKVILTCHKAPSKAKIQIPPYRPGDGGAESDGVGGGIRSLKQKFGCFLHSKKKRYAISGVLLVLFLYAGGYFGFVLLYSFNVNWHGELRYNSPIIFAVERSVFLEKDDLGRPLRRGKKGGPRLCAQGEMKSYSAALYGECIIVGWAPSKWCHSYAIYSPECRSITVSRKTWEDEEIRQRILYAALHPCEFLINVDKVDKEKFSQIMRNSPKLYGYEAKSIRMHKKHWVDAGCDFWPLNTVFFQIYEQDNLFNLKSHKPLMVYQAYLDKNRIEGRYARL